MRIQACRNGQGAEANVQQIHKGNQISLKPRTTFLLMISRLQSRTRGKECVKRWQRAPQQHLWDDTGQRQKGMLAMNVS